MAPPVSQVAYDLVVITCLVILIPGMIWVILASPIITQTTPSFIVAAITAIATLFTSVVKSRIQHGLMRHLEAPLRSINNAPEAEQLVQRRLIDRKWRAVLRIEGFTETWHTQHIFLVYLLSGLLTTALVTTFTPTAGTQTINYEPLVPGATYPFTDNGTSNACAGVMKGRTVQGTFGWDTSNDTIFFSSWLKDCPSSRVLAHVSNINNQNPEEFAYVQAGVAIHRTAMGASTNLFLGTAFKNLNKQYGKFLKTTTQCVPVMTKNPVTCYKGGGKLERVPGQDRELLFTGDGSLKGQARPVGTARNLSVSSAMVNYLWLLPLPSGAVGTSVAVFSAMNDPKAETRFYQDLARTINDPDKDAGTRGSETYVVTCDYNPQDSFEYRLVTLDLQAASVTSNYTSAAYSRLLKGGPSRTPTNKTVSNLHFAAVGTSAYKMIMEGFGLDGYFTSVKRIAGTDRKPPYAFNNSRNGLEDTLGVISAIAVSTMDLLDDAVVASAVEGKGGKAEATIDVKRLGGNRYVLIFIIPPALSLLTLLYFFVTSFQSVCQLGGGVTDGKRPKRYAAESIREIITLRQPAQGEIQPVEQQPLMRPHGV
ncbi:Ff.00g062500.m01.CDS01 [Fusarium sp. VM40]|nr:Ff.00g062500.m01.CDS01 [Fusarium sp. VM40]